MMYPIIAISTPIGIRALEYADAKIGAEATPPMFAKDATPKEKRSSLKSFAKSIMIEACMAMITKPAMIYRGASVNSAKLAREAIRATIR